MPRLIEAQIGNLAPRHMIFSVPEFIRDAPVVFRLQDGSLVMDAVPLIADQDLQYYAYELPTDELFGRAIRWDVDYGDSAINLATEIAWNAPLTGRLTIECAEATLDQFEGLPITDGHTDVEVGKREEVAVGTFLRDAVLDGNKVRSRALIYTAEAIVRAETDRNELSIGGMAYMASNPARGGEGEPDFFIKRINLNHVALVEEGRAGPEARLLNHKAKLANEKKEIPVMKVTINGAEIEVPDVAVNHFTAQISTLTTQVETATTATTTLENQVAALTTERDTAQGALSAAQAELTTVRNSVPDTTAAAVALANEHATFVTEAQRLGHSEPLVLGEYDRIAIMRSILNKASTVVADTASDDTVRGAWLFAQSAAPTTTTTSSPATTSQAVVDHAKPTSQTLTTIDQGANTAITNSYFGGPAKKEA